MAIFRIDHWKNIVYLTQSTLVVNPNLTKTDFLSVFPKLHNNLMSQKYNYLEYEI